MFPPTQSTWRWIVQVIPAGLFVLATSYMAFTAVSNGGDAAQSWEQMQALVRGTSTEWATGLALLILAFLAGSALRAIPVNLSDWIWGTLFGWTARADFTRLLYRDTFPYRAILESTLKAIQQNGRATGAALPADRTEHNMFYLWKIELAERSGTFPVVQDLEARVRLFSVMFLSGLWGLVATAVVMIWCGLHTGTLAGAFQPEHLMQLVVTAAVFVLFGSRLRPVRADEVLGVFIAHLLLREERGPGHALWPRVHGAKGSHRIRDAADVS